MNEELMAKAYEASTQGIFVGLSFVNGILVDPNGAPATDVKTLAVLKVFTSQTLNYKETVAVLGRKLTKPEAEAVIGRTLTLKEYEAL